MFFSLTLLLLTSTFVLARPDYSQLHHTRHFLEHRRPLQPTNGWSVVQAAPAEREIELSFALHTRNAGKLESTFWAVSDPQSKLYGKHLSLDQVTEMVAPHEETVADVRAWIEASGARIVRVPASRDWLIVRASVAQAEELLATEFHEFAHAQLDERVVRAMAPYSVPRELKGSVAFVSGVHTLPKVNAHRFHASPETASLAKRQTNPLIGPKQLRTRYNVTGVGAEAKNSMAVAEFQGQYYAPADLASFFKQYVDFAPPATVAGVRPAGSNNPNAPGVEASLDIEYIMGIAPNVTSYFYASASMDFWTSLDTWASLLAGEADCPLVHSISYGDQGGTSKPSKQYQERMNTEFQKLGARGISVIFASGDSGAGCEFCIYAEPSFPAVAPYVTSVGATRFINGVGSGEMAVESFGSGGGFAWDFSAPDYQKAAVDHYLTSNKAHLPYWFQYNTKGRGTPDVSALGIGFAVVVSGVTNEVGGTSASAPTFAAIVALLNDHRLAAKKTPLGFLNPWIYQTASKDPEAFYDVTKGTNSDGCCFTGFPAAAGWDASTGVGTPNFKQLLTHL